METHFSILAWKVPWMEEPGEVQSVGLHRVRHTRASNTFILLISGFPDGSDSKESACNPRDLCLIHESGRSLGEGNGNPLQYFCLENSKDRGV